MTRILVCGRRDYDNQVRLWYVLDYYRPAVVIHGAARGADTLAGEWAKARGVPVQEFPADWKRYGNAAGPIRNQQMLREGKPDVVIAFPGGRGTANMIEQARCFGVPVVQVSG